MKKVFVIVMLSSVIALNAQTVEGRIHGEYPNKYDYELTIDVPKISDYQIVESSDSKKLTASVKVLMQQGWVPYGPVAVVLSYGGDLAKRVYVQTMVKY